MPCGGLGARSRSNLGDKVGKLLGRTQRADASTGLKRYQQALKLNPGSAIGMVEYADGTVMLEATSA